MARTVDCFVLERQTYGNKLVLNDQEGIGSNTISVVLYNIFNCTMTLPARASERVM